jgi:spore germination protein KA
MLDNKRDEEIKNHSLSCHLTENYDYLKNTFKNCSDIVFRELSVGKTQRRAILVYIKSITEITTIIENVITPIINSEDDLIDASSENGIPRYIKRKILGILDYSEKTKLEDIIYELVVGNSAFILEGSQSCLIFSTQGGKSRNVEDSSSESVLRGPRDGFTEVIETNMGLIRHRIKTPQLKFEKSIIGKITKTQVIITYIDNVVNKDVLIELKKRLSTIDIDSILESSYIEELIEDHPNSLFPQIEHTERPDKVAADILEGRIGILVDGTPFALLVPSLAVQLIQSSDDYYERSIYTYMVRGIRTFFLVVGLLAPGIYVAVTTFNQELIPTPLLISIGAARQGIPFPTVLEVIILEISLETLREAGMRLPSSVGQSVSFIGALVIGDAAVRARIVSPATVIVVAITGVASFSTPSYSVGLGIRMLRFIIIGAAGFMGLYGIAIVMILIIVHILSLNSFGIPYFSPIAPLKWKDMKDVFKRASWRTNTERPESIGSKNKKRQKVNKK